MVSPRVGLRVNDEPVPIDSFVQEFIGNVVIAMLGVLKGAETMSGIKLAVKGEVVDISVNGSPVPVNPFVSKFVGSTILAMVSSLKGVGEIEELEIGITD